MLSLSYVNAQDNSVLELSRNYNNKNSINNMNFVPCTKNVSNMQFGKININKQLYQQNVLINKANCLMAEQLVHSQQEQIDMLKDVVKNKHDIIEYYRNQIRNKDEQIKDLLAEIK